MNKYIKFKTTIFDNENNNVIWEEGKEYLVTFEDLEYYYFGEPVTNGIDKKCDELFEIIVK